ncbi:MAG TPA: ABC transporter permease [Coriobacteriia bacterium]|nr:ABC transporter permease [Coriobacteriia bacterium]
MADETFYEKSDNRWLEMWRSMAANKAALVSMFFILALVFVAIFGKYLTPYNPIETNMANALKPPSPEHWFGTDQLGMDIFSRVIAGTRVSLTVGLLAVSIALTIGTVLGAIAGYVGGRVDTIIMRLMDMMLAIPSILLAITLMAALGKGIDKAVVAIGLVSIPEYARLVRGNILSIKENDYVAAARISGNSNLRIIFRHVLPVALSVIIVRATLGISAAILDTAALGFLGMGVQPPQAEWGDMLGRARGFIFQAPHTLLYPGLAITLTVLAFNLVGDGMRDALDPKSRIK